MELGKSLYVKLVAGIFVIDRKNANELDDDGDA